MKHSHSFLIYYLKIVCNSFFALESHSFPFASNFGKSNGTGVSSVVNLHNNRSCYCLWWSDKSPVVSAEQGTVVTVTSETAAVAGRTCTIVTGSETTGRGGITSSFLSIEWSDETGARTAEEDGRHSLAMWPGLQHRRQRPERGQAWARWPDSWQTEHWGGWREYHTRHLNKTRPHWTNLVICRSPELFYPSKTVVFFFFFFFVEMDFIGNGIILRLPRLTLVHWKEEERTRSKELKRFAQGQFRLPVSWNSNFPI